MNAFAKTGLAAGVLTLAACASTPSRSPSNPPDDPFPARPPKGTCDAALAQSYVGQRASSDVGAAILSASKARTLRWGPPNSVWTMDYRDDRVNARYDAAMTITDITCG